MRFPIGTRVILIDPESVGAAPLIRGIICDRKEMTRVDRYGKHWDEITSVKVTSSHRPEDTMGHWFMRPEYIVLDTPFNEALYGVNNG